MRILIASVVLASIGLAAEFPTAIRTVPVVTGLGNLTMVTNAADGSGRLFVLEQAGRILIIRDGRVVSRPFLDIRDRVLIGEERGLLGLAFPADFATKRWFIVNYTDRPNGNTVVARYRLTSDADVADPASEQVLFRVNQPYPNHNGGMVAFSPKDHMLYIGMGDGGSGGDPENRAQNDQSLLGKLLRFDAEPSTQSAAPQIWAKGLRNPWRFTFDRQTNDLWIADVGQNMYEEIDFQPASSTGGENYGWRRMEGLHCFEPGCSTAGLTLPIFEYDHSQGCSVTGGYVYRGPQYPALSGMYFFGDYCSGNVWGTRAAGSGFETRQLGHFNLNITSFGEDERGELYLVDGGGGLYKLEADVPVVAHSTIVNAVNGRPELSPGAFAIVNGSTIAGVPSVTVDGSPAKFLGPFVFQVPANVSTGRAATVVISSNGSEVDRVSMNVVDVSPSVLAVVRDGSTLTIYAMGLGSGRTPRVRIAGVDAEVISTTPMPGSPGFYIVTARANGVRNGSELVLSVDGIDSNSVRL